MTISPTRFRCAEVPEKPNYDAEVQENVDDALEQALETARIANAEYLEALLSNELASYRYAGGHSVTPADDWSAIDDEAGETAGETDD